MMSVVCSTVLVILIYLFRRKGLFIRSFGISTIVFLYILCVIRMSMPYEFFFTREVEVKTFLNSIYQMLYLEKLGRTSMSILTILVGLWVFVLLVLIISFFLKYIKAVRKIAKYNMVNDSQITRIMAQVFRRSKRNIHIAVRHSKEITVPMGLGIFSKTILLPDEDYSDVELFHILHHEYTHFENRDLLIKMLIHIFCYVFWWNPFMHLLKKDLARTMEMKCDMCVTEKMTEEEKVSYLTTIVSILKKANQKKQVELSSVTAELVKSEYQLDIVERFRIVAKSSEKQGRREKVAVAVWSLATIIIMLISYSFVLQTSYEPPIRDIETKKGVQGIDSEDAYIMKESTGDYFLILEGEPSLQIDKTTALQMEKNGFNVREEKK